ncbi:DUF2059 domain-containing protein [Prosthecobacter sp.]|uniref:DUF2059 domain-containing protein n=1 Tax=Prosthecobacter sp. TaxID=1965333 RepID=UPI003784A702
MKKLLLLATFATLSLCLGTARAEVSASHAAALEKMFTVMKLDEQYEARLIASFEAGIGITPEQIKALPPAQQAKFNAAITKVQAKLMGTLGWTQMKGEMIEAYAKVFSEKEAGEVIALMDTPAGQMLAAKEVLLVRDIVNLTQSKMKDLLPAITQIIQEEMAK